MAYIQPTSNIQFFADIGLSSTYDDTMYFPDSNSKTAYYDAIPKLAVAQNCSYTRENRGFIRVEIPMSQIYNAAYMRFNNILFENKYFYAFVKSVNYINNSCTEVEFEIDVMQTWMGVFTLGECFVERQHTLSDAIGDNICDEGLATGDYIYNNVVPTGYFNDSSEYGVAVTTTLDTSGQKTWEASSVIDGVYSGAQVIHWPYITDRTSIDTFFENATKSDNEGSIAAVGMYPRAFDGVIYPAKGLDVTPITKPYTDIDGYVPKNNKLFVAPYNILTVTNTEGSFRDYRYEFFNTDTCQFHVYCTKKVPVEALLVPKYYKNDTENINESITMSNFPQCGFINDTYAAYIAQRTSGTVQGALLGGVSGFMAGSIPGAVVGAVAGGVANSGIVKDIAHLLTGTVEPGTAGKAAGNPAPDVTYASDKKDFYFLKKQITHNYAIMIDDFFTAFGYKVNQVIQPQMNARPHWTYLKTQDCNVHGDLPSDDAAQIERIINAGCRFWRNHNEIGHYSLYDNRPV